MRSWLTARSIGRGSPPPVADRGGWRVDTGSDVEAVRWVFPYVTDGLRALANAVREPRSFIHASDGAIAASGYGIEAAGFFVYDRIVTDAAHRRRGLGRAVMHALGRERSDATIPQLLVATHDGRALYATLGWSVVARYASASIPAS